MVTSDIEYISAQVRVTCEHCHTCKLSQEDMETGVRRRKVPGSSGEDQEDDKRRTEGGGGKSASVDSTCTYLILLLAATLASCALLVHLAPDHPFALVLMRAVDTCCHALGLTTPVQPQNRHETNSILATYSRD